MNNSQLKFGKKKSNLDIYSFYLPNFSPFVSVNLIKRQIELISKLSKRWVYLRIAEELQFGKHKLLQTAGESTEGLGWAIFMGRGCKEGRVHWESVKSINEKQL